MLNDYERFNVELLKLYGIALITPFARILLQPTVVASEFNKNEFIIYLSISIMMLVHGLQMLGKCCVILETKEKLNAKSR